MPYLGDTDLANRVIRINKNLHKKVKKTGKEGELINTIVHEELHRKHPKMLEKTVRKKTKEEVRKLSEPQKHKLYGYYAK